MSYKFKLILYQWIENNIGYTTIMKLRPCNVTILKNKNVLVG